jgi:hypothetical protein
MVRKITQGSRLRLCVLCFQWYWKWVNLLTRYNFHVMCFLTFVSVCHKWLVHGTWSTTAA